MRNSVQDSVLTCSALFIVWIAMQASAQKIAPASGKAMCSALTSSDFTNAGFPVSGLRLANLDDNRSAYCIYDSKAGKVEFDIFYPAGDTPAEAQNAARAAQSAIGGKFETASVAGADEATTNAGTSQGTDSPSIVVRKGTTVFNISIPHSAHARQGLTTLSETVVTRLKK